MKRFLIRISASDWEALRYALFTDDGEENAAVLLCGLSQTDQYTRLLTRNIRIVPHDDYDVRSSFHLRISPAFYNRTIDECIAERLSPVLVHSHPFSREARYSESDDFGERRLLPVLEDLVPSKLAASLLVAPAAVSARRLVHGKFHLLSGICVSGNRSRNFRLDAHTDESKARAQFDRQIRAWGLESQQLIENLEIGVVGVGGTGSLVAEQLARAGIRRFVLVDPDTIDESNISRLFGSKSKDIGSLKTKVVRSHLLKLGAKAVTAITDSAIRQPVLMQLRDCDVIFSCVDNDRSRSILTRFSHQYLVPVVDVGIRLDGRSGDIMAAAGRVSVVGIGMLCLRCSHHLSSDRIRAESLPSAERRALEKEGYIMGIDDAAPSVVSLNTTIAGLAVTAGLNLFVNLTGGPQPLNQLYDATTGTVFTTRQLHEDRCDICDPVYGVKGIGDAQIVSAYD